MEALPPYTRYPEQSFPGSTQAEAASSSPVAAGASSVEGSAAVTTAGIPGAGGIGIATRNPEYSSTEDNLPVTRSARGANSSDTSQSDSINVAAQKFAEKLPSGKWQRRARRKLWGVIPYWAICLLVLGLIVVGVVMGAVLGILLKSDKKNKPDGDE
jgi:flagellar biosynthesis/type III secretory pathway M-ring protein FliF/YscJ